MEEDWLPRRQLLAKDVSAALGQQYFQVRLDVLNAELEPRVKFMQLARLGHPCLDSGYFLVAVHGEV